MKKWLFRILIFIVFGSVTSCLIAPRTAWTPDKYKKKNLNTTAPKTRR